MTDESLLTKCPHCQTLFRIQQEHLAAAGGEVRCGVCYKVFDAEKEGLSYSHGEGSPAEKTFANQDEKSSGNTPNEAIIDTSPEPEPDPQQALAAADINQDTAAELSAADIQKFSVDHSSISDIITSDNTRYNTGSALKWTAFSLLAVAALFSQWLVYNFEEKAHQPPWHSLYVVVCDTLGCELPQYRNITTIKTERLAIKTHPDYSNVLIVDMIISNSADHSQPLPLLNMAFFGINGKPLAQRLFQPREYLGKQLENLPLMPPKTPIHLSFAIIDPGDKAVNYSVNFSPAS